MVALDAGGISPTSPYPTIGTEKDEIKDAKNQLQQLSSLATKNSRFSFVPGQGFKAIGIWASFRRSTEKDYMSLQTAILDLYGRIDKLSEKSSTSPDIRHMLQLKMQQIMQQTGEGKKLGQHFTDAFHELQAQVVSNLHQETIEYHKKEIISALSTSTPLIKNISDINKKDMKAIPPEINEAINLILATKPDVAQLHAELSNLVEKVRKEELRKIILPFEEATKIKGCVITSQEKEALQNKYLSLLKQGTTQLEANQTITEELTIMYKNKPNIYEVLTDIEKAKGSIEGFKNQDSKKLLTQYSGTLINEDEDPDQQNFDDYYEGIKQKIQMEQSQPIPDKDKLKGLLEELKDLKKILRNIFETRERIPDSE